MKNLIIIACFGMVLFFTFGCGKKGETPPATINLIQGKWTEDSALFVTYKNSVVSGTSKESTPDGSYFQFNANDKGINYQPAFQVQGVTYPAITLNITYTLVQSKLSLNYPSYTSGGFSYDPYTDLWTVLKLTDHQLAIRYSDDENNGGGDTGNDFVQYFYFSR